MNNSHSTLAALMGTPSAKIRGNWHHYRCFMCEDRSTHLGINIETGKVKCLRCGFSYSMAVESGGLIPPSRVSEGLSHLTDLYEYKTDGNIADTMVQAYMDKRGVSDPETGWAFGRGKWFGYVVFPILNIKGVLVYVQWRKTCGGHAVKWVSYRRTKPRLDCYQLVNPDTRAAMESQETLVLTEGPVDALKVRLFTGMWSSPTFGSDIHDRVIDDINRAKNRTSLREVVILYDNDPTGKVRSESAMYKVRVHCGLNCRMAKWPFNSDFNDPGQVNRGDFMEQLLRRR